jgi:hypothetical protein
MPRIQGMRTNGLVEPSLKYPQAEMLSLRESLRFDSYVGSSPCHQAFFTLALPCRSWTSTLSEVLGGQHCIIVANLASGYDMGR